MPIWPKTTFAKAALFNKYGRGIIHMGLHEGESVFVVDRGGRRVRRRPLRRINTLELNVTLDEIEAAIDLAPVAMVVRQVKGQGTSPTYTWDGTGNDWRLIPYMKIVGDFGPTVIVDAKSSIGSFDGDSFYRFAVAIDGIVDITTCVRFYDTVIANANRPEIRTVVYPGPGAHTFQLAVVLEAVDFSSIYLFDTHMRLTGLIKKEGQ